MLNKLPDIAEWPAAPGAHLQTLARED